MSGVSDDRGTRAGPNVFRSTLISISPDQPLPQTSEHCVLETAPYRRDQIATSNLHPHGLYLESTVSCPKTRTPRSAPLHKACFELSVPPVPVRVLVFESK